MCGGNGRSDLVEDTPAQHQVRKRLPDTCPRDGARNGAAVCLQISDILIERNRSGAHIAAVLEEEQCPLTARVGDAVAVRRSADTGAANDFALVEPLDKLEHRIHYRKLDAETTCDFDPRQLASEVQ